MHLKTGMVICCHKRQNKKQQQYNVNVNCCFRISIAENQIAHASLTSESTKKIEELEEQLQTLSGASNK